MKTSYEIPPIIAVGTTEEGVEYDVALYFYCIQWQSRDPMAKIHWDDSVTILEAEPIING